MAVKNTPWFAFFVLTSIEALAATFYLLSIPGDPKNSVFLGFSLSRLVLAGGLLLAFGIALGLALRVRFRGWTPNFLLEKVIREEKNWRALAGCAFVLFVLVGCIVLIPSYRVGRWGAMLERSRPLLLWLALVSGQLAALLWGQRFGFHVQALKRNLTANHATLRVMFGFLLLFAVVGVFIAVTGTGIQPDTMHWNENGVPLMSEQVLISLVVMLAGLVVERLSDKWRVKRWLDVALFFLIWLVAAVLWVAEPQPPTFFAPGPYPPNEELYPFSDAQTYDLSAQYALIGQKLGNGFHVDKPLYSVFLLGLHLLAGQNFSLFVNMQSAILALLPALVFLLSRQLFNRPAGCMAASLMMFYGINAISASRYILVSHPKLIMSEFPLAVLLALFVIWLMRWLMRPDKDRVAPLAVGGILSLATLVRHNVWLLAAAIPLFALPVFWRRWRAWLFSVALMMGMLFLTMLPWMWRTTQVIGTPFYFLGPLRGVVWTNRYLPSLSTPTPSPTNGMFIVTSTVSDEDVQPASSGGNEPAAEMTGKLSSVVSFVSAHFFHNLIASVFVLPLTPVFEDLSHILREVFPFWKLPWDGTMPLLALICLAFNLFLISSGIAGAWRRWRYAGWIPLLVWITYLAACAVARTSGGRYIVPANWIVLGYYAIGWVEILRWLRILLGVEDEGFENQEVVPSQNKTDWLRLAFAAFMFLLVGSFPLIADVAFPRLYPEQSETELLKELDQAGILNQSGLDFESLAAFAETEGAWVARGRALYPRFYLQDQGEAENYTRIRPYPRLTFYLIGADLNSGVILPLDRVSPLSDGADVIVIGCTGKNAVNAWSVIWLEHQIVYHRSPASPLHCPLSEPKCDENHHCQ